MAATGVSTTLRERIAALQQRGTSPQPTSPPRSKTPTNISNANSTALRDKIARFEEKGGVPIPRGSFALGAPLQLHKPNHEMLGNRIVSAGHLTSGRELARSNSLNLDHPKHSRSVSTSDPRLDNRYQSSREDVHDGHQYDSESNETEVTAIPSLLDMTSFSIPSSPNLTKPIPMLIVEPSTPLFEQEIETKAPQEDNFIVISSSTPENVDLASTIQLFEPTGPPAPDLSMSSDQSNEMEPVDTRNTGHSPLPIILESPEADIVPVSIAKSADSPVDMADVQAYNSQTPNYGIVSSEDRYAVEETIWPVLDQSAFIPHPNISSTTPCPQPHVKYGPNVHNDVERVKGRSTDMVVSNSNDTASSSEVPSGQAETPREADVSHAHQFSSQAPDELKPVLDSTAPLPGDCKYDNQLRGLVQDTAVTEAPPGSLSQSNVLDIHEEGNELVSTPTFSTMNPSSSRPHSTSTIFSESSFEHSAPLVTPILDAFPSVPGHVPSPNTPTRAHTISGFRTSVNRTSNSSIKSTPSLTFSAVSSSSTGSPTSSTINAPQSLQMTPRPASSLQRSKSRSRPVSSVPFWYDDDSDDDGEAGWATVVVTKRYY